MSIAQTGQVRQAAAGQAPHAGAQATGSDRIALGTVLLTILCALFLGWPLYRLMLPLEIDSNEAWNAWQIDRAMAGLKLYPDPQSLIANNYPPLSFYLAGLLARLTGDTILAGRLLSLLGTLMSGAAIFVSLRQLGTARWPAALAAIWFVATLARMYWNYVGMNDPHLLGLGVMLAGLAWLLMRTRKGQSAEPALAVMVLAGFIKHSLWAIPVTGLAWLAMETPARFWRALLAAALMAALGLALCVLCYGTDFISGLMSPRSMSLTHLLIRVGRLQTIAPALVIWGLWIGAGWRERAGRLSAIFIGASLLAFLVQSLANGVANNAQFELAAASALGLGLAVDGLARVERFRRFGISRAQAWIVAALVLRLLLTERTEPFLLLTPGFRTQIASQVERANAEIARVRKMKDGVVCSIPTACYRAGKPFVFDEFITGQRVATGKWSHQHLNAEMSRNGVVQVVTDASMEWNADVPAIFRIQGIK